MALVVTAEDRVAEGVHDTKGDTVLLHVPLGELLALLLLAGRRVGLGDGAADGCTHDVFTSDPGKLNNPGGHDHLTPPSQ